MTTTNRFQVTGMSCAHCESAVRAEVSGLGGVELVEVDAATGRLVITSQAPLSELDVIAAVAGAGYDAVRA